MLEVFGLQNKALVVKRWKVFHREERKDGTALLVDLDDLSIYSLAKTENVVFYVSMAVVDRSFWQNKTLDVKRWEDFHENESLMLCLW